MWIFTPLGFYSVVKKDPKGKTLNIRARAREDLLNLEPYLGQVEVIELDFTDYRYRIEVPQKTWAKVMARLVEQIDYSNFKNEVKEKQGYGRSSLYARVWSVMLDLQPFRPWAKYHDALPLFDSSEEPEEPAAGDEVEDPYNVEVICTSCGWYGETKDLKPIYCSQDSRIDTGFKRCPECNDGDRLEYVSAVPAGHRETTEDVPF